jgi:magnesium transporter
MRVVTLEEVLENLRDALRDKDVERAVRTIESLQPADQADLFEELGGEDQVTLFSHLDPADSADVLEEMEDPDAAALARLLDPADLADILDEMELDEAADVLGDLDPDEAAEALREMEAPGEVIPLLQYPDDTAGGLMSPAVVSLRRRWRVQEALEHLRWTAPGADTAYYLFVTDEDGVLQGVVGLRDLVVAQPETTIEALMDPEVISVPVTADQELCARLLARYGYLALPVVDSLDRLVGVITADDLIEVAEDEATEDMYRMAGIGGEAQVFAPVRTAVWRRLPWLIINMLTILIATTVVNAFEEVIAGLVLLATFLPLVSGEGGNAGSQTTTVIVRGLALGEIDLPDALRALAKELPAGIVNGTVVGALAAGIIWLWKANLVVALAAGLAMVLNFVMAALAGVLVPLGLKAVRIDPALASAAFVTALTDTMGFLFFLGIATLLLRLA